MVENQSILVIFGTLNPEEILKYRL